MPLNQTQLQQINAGLQSLAARGILKECPVCDSQDIAAGDVIVYNTVSTGQPLANVRVEVGCNNCGHVMLFSADKLGMK